MSNTNTENMLAIYHLDRGINVSLEMKMMFANLKQNPKEFNSNVATKMERLCDIIYNCFQDCYYNSECGKMSYDNIINALDKDEEHKKQRKVA